MVGRNISIIYFYLVSLISLILVVIGFFFSVNYVVNTTVYDQYPLRDHDSCDYLTYTPAPSGFPQPSKAEIDKQKKECLARIDFERRKNKIDDLKNAITFPIVGLILFAIHFPLARKQSRNA